jgi:hypothetical protein
MTAAYRLKGLGWLAGCAVVTLAFYLVSLQVATERKKLEATNRRIAQTEREIRALETEFDTRANLAQLERWNGDTLALAAPVAGQFVRDEGELAAVGFRPDAPGGAEVRQVALVVPAAVAPAAAAPVAPVPDPAQPPARPAVAVAVAARPAAPTIKAAAVSTERRATLRPAVAMVEKDLLSRSTLGALMSGARAEKGSLR